MDTNTRIIINYNTWERRDNFEFFKDFQNPSWSVTCDVECTEAFEKSKKEKSSFFLRYLYAILKAVNEIPELRYRIEKVENGDGNSLEETNNYIIVLYKKVSVITPIQVGENGKFHSVNIPYHKSFEQFEKNAQEIIRNIPTDTHPYAAENSARSEKHKFMDMILVAANPNLAFSSMTCTQSSRHGSEKPLINVGKATLKEGKMYIPVFISVHHGLCDGYHISLFYEKVAAFLKSM